jgi:hypothetical protein
MPDRVKADLLSVFGVAEHENDFAVNWSSVGSAESALGVAPICPDLT